MRDMFAALAVDDEKALRGFWTSDFYAFDGGTRLDAQGLIDYVKGRHASGVIYTWSVPDPKVHVRGDLATITYENKGTMTEPSGCVPMVWLEGAILLRQDGRWRIEFIHSTRAPAAYNAVHGHACTR
jgi:ketosteroid isomerase-like protein